MRTKNDPCGLCSFLGTYLPWLMIITGGIMSALPIPDSWDESAAWVMALGLAVLTISYLLARLKPDEHAT